MVYIIKFKEGPTSEYYMTSEYSDGIYTLFLLDFPSPGVMMLLNSYKAIKEPQHPETKNNFYIVFAAIDLTQLVAFFQSRNVQMMLSHIIDEAESIKFQKYVEGKKSNIINLGKK